MFKVIASLGLVATLSFSVVACSERPQPTSSSTPSETATPSPTPEYEVAPLTGISYLKGTNLDLAMPAVMGKVDNSDAARPQNALNSADVVIEEMVEGGMTRFIGVWHSKLPAKFGPVRSVRPMDPDLAGPFGGILAFSGGQKDFVNAMLKTNVLVATETTQLGKKTFERVTDRYAPHNIMVNAQKLASQHKSISPPRPQYSFSADALTSSAFLQGKVVKSIVKNRPSKSFYVTFPALVATWSWDATSNLWLRSTNGTKEIDASDGKQLSATNLVVLQIKINRSYKDFKYGYVPRTVVIGGGKGVVFTGGKALAVTFKKDHRDDPIQLFDKTGSEVKLAPGNTWVELMPSNRGWEKYQR
jgi:hypothetical protein